MDDQFFFLSKIIWSVLSPSSIMIWLLILASLLLWLNYVSAARRLLTLMSLIGFLMLAYPVSDYLMYPLENRFKAPETLPEKVDGIIVLGGAEQLKLSVSWNSAEVGEAAERILAAAELSRLYPDIPVIYTGGSNLLQMQNIDKEGSVSQTLLRQAGIAKERLIIETQARNTSENFQLIAPLLPDSQGSYVLVTSAYHMPRAIGVARKHGVNVFPYPVDHRSSHSDERYWDFDLFEHLQVLEPAWHEWLGLTAYYVTGKTSAWLPKPVASGKHTEQE